MKTGMIFVLATALASSTVNAATLQDIQGDVRVGRDKGFTRIDGSTEVQPGDKIKVGRKAAARLVHPDGCSEPLGANSLSRVATHSPCSFKALAGDNSAPVYVPVQEDSRVPCDPFVQDTPDNRDRWIACALLLGLAGAGAGLAATWPGGTPPFAFFPPPGPQTSGPKPESDS